MAHPIGRTGFGLISVISSIPEYEIRAELYIDPPNTKRAFPILQQNQKQIEAALGFPLIWHSPEESAARRLYTRKDADFLNQALWPEQFEWLRQRLEIMHKVFAPKLKDL